MSLATKLRYQGYLSTPPLWEGDAVSPFQQIELTRNFEDLDDSAVFKNQRLGKLVEAFVFHQLKQQNTVAWICDNLQIQQGKRTVGEIDALYYNEENPIHLEVAYKFYLYDTSKDDQEPLAYWIGPNRKDSLVDKLAKLQNKQFPLLHHELAQPYLERYQLAVKTIKQALCFKAQLFLPYQNRGIDIRPLNNNCIAGFHLPYHQLAQFETHEFFLPTKLDWLVTPYHDVGWVSYSAASAVIEMHINNQRSPMVWIKASDNGLSKCFITFW